MGRFMSTRSANRRAWAVGLVSIAAAGVVGLRYATPEGLGLVNDSAAYLNGARGLLAGAGYVRVTGDGSLSAITHFPPLYSLLLAAVSRLTPTVFAAAAMVNLVLFGGSILLMGWLAFRLTRRAWAALLSAALFTASEAFLRVYTFALSEPLFIFLTLAALLAISFYLDAPKGRGRALMLVCAGALTGLAYLTRYVGVALLAVALPMILFYQPGWRRRLADAAWFLTGALPLALAWSLRNWLTAGSATNRQVGWHPVALVEWQEGLRNFWEFVLPSRVGLYDRLPEAVWGVVLALFLAGLIFWLVARAVRLIKTGGAPRSWLGGLVGLHLLGYLALIVISMTVMDASTIFEDRILAPLYVDLLLLLALLLNWLIARPSAAVRGLALLAAAGLLLSGMDDARRAANLLAEDGQGFASTGWAQSQTLAALRELPQGEVYTNRLSAVNILTERPAYALLSDVDPVTLQPRADYAKTQSAIRAAVQAGRAFLVVFDSAGLQDDPAATWFRQLVDGLPVRGVYPDGVIYGRGGVR